MNEGNDRRTVDKAERKLIEIGEPLALNEFKRLLGIANKGRCLPRSALFVGVILQYGIGQKKDEKKALRYFQMAREYEISKGVAVTNPLYLLKRKF